MKDEITYTLSKEEECIYLNFPPDWHMNEGIMLFESEIADLIELLEEALEKLE
jgi:hypothetical protein